ncbi:hypothetical protein Hanom_Chr04g00287581 [Helianthus anomalus]
MLLHKKTSNTLRDDRRLLPKLIISSFSPKLTRFEQSFTSNFFKFTRTLLASASDSHKYLISLHSSMLISSTAPMCSITPLHTSYVSPETELISSIVIDEAA